MQFKQHTLPNGLSIVAECNDAAHSTALGVFVNTGSRDESDDIAGVSHFLEHMMFKGTPRRSAEQVNREFDEIGAHYNAYTSEENTVYYGAVLPEHQQACTDLLLDIMRPSLREEDFETEKQVILEEIQMYLDQPPYGMDDRVKQLCFGQHPITRSVLGTAHSVGALSAQQMRAYFDRRYGPSTMTVAAAGRVDFKGLIEQVEQIAGGWTTTDQPRPATEPTATPTFQSIQQENATQQYVLRLSGGPDAADPDRYAAKLLATIVGDDSGSRLYWELIDNGQAESASLGHYEYEGVGMYYGWMSCEPTAVESNLGILQQVLSDVQREGVLATELDQARNKLKSRVVLGGERPRNRLFSVGGNWIQRQEYRSVRDDLQVVDSITVEDIRRVLDRFPLDQAATVTVGPRDAIVAPS